jgi:hypothetical protein
VRRAAAHEPGCRVADDDEERHDGQGGEEVAEGDDASGRRRHA